MVGRSSEVLIRTGRLADADDVFPLLEQFAMSYRPRRAAFDCHYPLLLGADHVELLVAELDRRVREPVGSARAIGFVEGSELRVHHGHRGCVARDVVH